MMMGWEKLLEWRTLTHLLVTKLAVLLYLLPTLLWAVTSPGPVLSVTDGQQGHELPTLPRPAASSPSPPLAPIQERHDTTVAESLPTMPELPAPAIRTVQVPLDQMVSSTLSIADMGQPDGLLLSDGQLTSGIVFTLPTDWVVMDATLLLNIEISPALLEGNADLRMMLNGQSLGKLALNEHNEANAAYQVAIPAEMVVAHNNLSFSIQDNNNTPILCEKGAPNHHWVKVLPTSRLQLENQVLNVAPDLGRFPRPFFDPLAMQNSVVTMVFGQPVRAEDVSAAAVVSSYFGVQSRYRNYDFQVLLNDLPEHNGIVFARPGEQIGHLTLPKADGPTLKIIDNPLNPVYKLLLVLGRNPTEMRQAAYRLVSQTLPENSALLAVKPIAIPQRRPYDAPRWISTEHPVSFDHLVASDDELMVRGVYHDGLRIAFRAAPDLFMLDGKNIPLRLHYRFPTDSWIDEEKSALSVTLNGTFLRNLTVNKSGLLQLMWRKFGGDIRQESFNLPLPPYLIYGDNMLVLYFSIVSKQNTPCNLLDGDTVLSRIELDSSIDLSHTYHFTELPNLSYFVGAAFPFSKLADFSQTILLLADHPSRHEIQALLNLMAQAGNATGTTINNAYAQLGLQGNEMDNPEFKGRDVLAVASLGQSGFYRQLLSETQFGINDKRRLMVKPLSTFGQLLSYLRGHWGSERGDADRYLSSVADWRGFFSFQSAWAPQRTIVVASASTDEGIVKIHADLKSPKINGGIRGDLAVITDKKGVQSFQVSELYASGEMPWYLVVIWYASKHVILLALMGLVISVVLGLNLYVLLRRHAAKRLGRDAEDEHEA